MFDYTLNGDAIGSGGTGVLSVDGTVAATNSIDHGTPITFPEDETFDVGLDTRTGLAMVEIATTLPSSSPVRFS